MRALRLVLGDQLSDTLSSLRDIDAGGDVVLMAEVMAEAEYVRHHKQKLVMVFAAMRRFADRLRARGFTVRYVRLDDPDNTHALDGEVRRAFAEAGPFDRLVLTEAGEWRLHDLIEDMKLTLPAPVEVWEDDRFLCRHADFAAWAEDRKELRMEFFYREMRRKTGLLMDGDKPAGGQWNFDKENRKRLPRGLRPPHRAWITPDALTRAVIAEVEARFSDNFGTTERFGWATGHDEAERLLHHFITDILPGFGDYEDAMAKGEPFLWHGLISAAINIGLIDPLDACRRAEAAWRGGHAPLNAVEGFIRQIIGWREFVRGIYWLQGPDYKLTNALGADRPLPWFYWSGETDMACVADVVAHTRDYAYAHHIQRLMVTGNLAMLLGVDPAQVDDWYMVVFIDAFEWVELPNTHGMATFADGGVVGSKPYAAGGAYIDRMSDYCGGCRYDVKARAGPDACPFNILYWDFLSRNEERLKGNHRLAMPYRSLAGFTPARRAEIAREGETIRTKLCGG
jgi:deoxyribodipyrimidine photolyase-related protein